MSWFSKKKKDPFVAPLPADPVQFNSDEFGPQCLPPKPKKRIRYYLIWNYIWQPIVAMLFLWILLFGIDQMETSQTLWSVVVTSIVSTTFLIFVLPDSPSAQWFRVLFGYAVALLVGELLHVAIEYLYNLFPMVGGMKTLYFQFAELGAVLSFLFITFVMIFTRIQHAPAVAFGTLLVMQPTFKAAQIPPGSSASTAVAVAQELRRGLPHITFVEIIFLILAVIILVLIKVFMRNILEPLA